MSAPLCIAFRRSQLAWLLSLTVSWISFAIAITLLEQVISNGPITYLLGNWAAPWGIEYKVDLLAAFVLVLVSGMGSVTIFFAPESVGEEIPDDRAYIFYAMYLLTFSGLLGMTITGDAFHLFIFMETA